MRTSLKQLWAMPTLLALLLSLLASPLQADLQLPTASGLKAVGRGELRWFGFHVYDASTWAAQQSLPNDGSIPTPFALQIVYARSISARDLVRATETAWDELGLLDAQAKIWLPQLAKLWPNVAAGDCLVLHLDANGQSQFFYNGKLLGQLGDAEFARRFAAIWLHPDSSEPELRRQLLGKSS